MTQTYIADVSQDIEISKDIIKVQNSVNRPIEGNKKLKNPAGISTDSNVNDGDDIEEFKIEPLTDDLSLEVIQNINPSLFPKENL